MQKTESTPSWYVSFQPTTLALFHYAIDVDIVDIVASYSELILLVATAMIGMSQ